MRAPHVTAALYFSHPACLEHDPRVHSPGHPDTPERLLALEAALAERDWLGWERREAPAASEAQLELVHSAEHVRSIAELCAAGGGAIDADTFVGEASFRAALHAAGGASAMTSSLLAGEAPVGFCGVRPSGHHAERDRAMGFCLFDNIAVAAAVAIAELGLRRVFVLDWDVHHGNGTAEIFRRRSRRAVREHPPDAAVSRQRSARGRRLGPRARATRSTCPCRRDRASRCGWGCSSGWCCPPRARSSPSWCSCRPASTPTRRTRWPTAACRRARS